MTSGQLHIQPHNTMEVGNSNQASFKNSELLSKRSKRKTTIIVLLVVLVAFVIAAFLYLQLRRPETTVKGAVPFVAGRHGMSLKSVIEGEFNPRSFNGTWISDSQLLYKSRSGNLMMFDANKNTSSSILSPNDVEVLSRSFQYKISADKKYLLLAHDYQKLYRYSHLALYHIVDLETKKFWPLSDINGSSDGGQMAVQHVAWAPVGNAFVYVYMNDIYYRTSARDQAIEFRLTRTGRPGTIYNGVPDWVYEEEVLSSNEALWFSPDGRHLAFATFNDSQTPVMTIPYYGVPGDMRSQYTQSVNIRYPKPGRANPSASLNIIDLQELQYGFGKPFRQVDVPPPEGLKEPILAKVLWTASSNILSFWWNRVQTDAAIIHCSTSLGSCRKVLDIVEEEGWVIFNNVFIDSTGRYLTMILPFDQGGDAGRFRHVAFVDIHAADPVPIPLTRGKFVVIDLLAMDDKHIYFTANEEDHPERQNIYRVPWTRLGAPHTPECFSCLNSETDSGQCTYVGGVFSQKSNYLTQTCAGPVVPEVVIIKKTGEKVRVWEDNARVKRKLGNVLKPETMMMNVEVAPGLNALVKLHLPPGMDKSGDTKYPLLVQVYGGPDSSMVNDKFDEDWDTYLVVNESIVHARIDARGSGLKGDKMTFAVYRKLGVYEIMDQINVTRHLIDKLDFIDPTKTAIWGWSYGGYATGMVLAKDTQNIFKCGISVAPVTDWILYDTIYTERFMGLPTPDDNLKGYEAASINNKIDNFKNKKFFLIHGTLDDNVHYQQSMMLAKALELEDILFEQQSYPDENHGLSDVRPHLYHSLQHFLKQCYRREE